MEAISGTRRRPQPRSGHTWAAHSCTPWPLGALNLFLATKMAQYGRGTFTHLADIHEIQQQMTQLFETIESPVLTDVKLSSEGVEVADVFPERMTRLGPLRSSDGRAERRTLAR